MSKRPIMMSWIRKNQLNCSLRRYSRVENALSQIMKQFFLQSHPGDVFELAHSEYGFQILTVKVYVGRFSIILSADLTRNQVESYNGIHSPQVRPLRVAS